MQGLFFLVGSGWPSRTCCATGSEVAAHRGGSKNDGPRLAVQRGSGAGRLASPASRRPSGPAEPGGGSKPTSWPREGQASKRKEQSGHSNSQKLASGRA